MKRFKGTVKNGVVILEKGVQLANGTAVEVRLAAGQRRTSKQQRLHEAIQKVLADPIMEIVGIDEVIEADKREREAHWDS